MYVLHIAHQPDVARVADRNGESSFYICLAALSQFLALNGPIENPSAVSAADTEKPRGAETLPILQLDLSGGQRQGARDCWEKRRFLA